MLPQQTRVAALGQALRDELATPSIEGSQLQAEGFIQLAVPSTAPLPLCCIRSATLSILGSHLR